jgi:hypothetical protein
LLCSTIKNLSLGGLGGHSAISIDKKLVDGLEFDANGKLKLELRKCGLRNCEGLRGFPKKSEISALKEQVDFYHCRGVC